MDQLQIDRSLNTIDYTFRWTGLIVDNSRKTKSKIERYRFLYILNFLLLNTDVLGAVAWFIDSARKGANFTTLTYVAPCVTFCFVSNTKSIYFLLCEKQINELLSILRKLEINHNESEKVLEKQKIVEEDTKFLFLVLKILRFFKWFLAIAFPLMPLSLMALEYYETKKVIYLLPFRVLYPFDAYNIKNWPFVYIRHTWETVFVLLMISGVDYFLFISITFICIQFRLLQYEITTLIPENLTNVEEVEKKLFALVRWHQELIHCVDLLETIYTNSTLLNFVSSSVVICLAGFNVLMVDDKPFVLSFASFLVMSLFQILALCYYGDMLMKSSVKVSDAVYCSKWYLTHPRVGKNLYIMQMRAQKPCKVTAKSFADVNLTAFTKILSTAWSYFALLNTIYSSPRVELN